MVSIAEPIYQGALAIFLGSPLLLGMGILIVFGALFAFFRFNLSVTLIFLVVLLDGFVGFNYGQRGAEFNGTFSDPLFVGFLIASYLAILVVIALGAIKAFNK
jgi:hypothetical protein